MNKTLRKLYTFLILLVLLISFSYSWIKINKGSWSDNVKKFITDEDVFKLIFNQGLGLLIGVMFVTFASFVIFSVFKVRIR